MKRRRISAQELDAALSELAQLGDIDAVLRRHPERARDLEPLLYTASRVRIHYASVPEAPGGLAAGRRRLIQAAAQMRKARTRTSGLARLRVQCAPLYRPSPAWRVMVAVLAVVLFLSSLGGGAVWASEKSLPGDPLYPVKWVVEDVRLTLKPEPESRVALSLHFCDERLEEIQTILFRGDQPVPEKVVQRLEWQFRYAVELAASTQNAQGQPLLSDLYDELDAQIEKLGSISRDAPPQVREGLDVVRERMAKEFQDAGDADDDEAHEGSSPSSEQLPHPPASEEDARQEEDREGDEGDKASVESSQTPEPPGERRENAQQEKDDKGYDARPSFSPSPAGQGPTRTVTPPSGGEQEDGDKEKDKPGKKDDDAKARPTPKSPPSRPKTPGPPPEPPGRGEEPPGQQDEPDKPEKPGHSEDAPGQKDKDKEKEGGDVEETHPPAQDDKPDNPGPDQDKQDHEKDRDRDKGKSNDDDREGSEQDRGKDGQDREEENNENHRSGDQPVNDLPVPPAPPDPNWPGEEKRRKTG
ncbi:MAG: hypothetical protein H5T69_13765 [Chloroflexi bacterium]|nr:hypothetical protein [Chloroflexota bacterium]